jgi:tRNA-dihydrouridine synthase A
MMEYTDRHFRHLLRLLSKRAVLYSEMVVSNAVHHNRQTTAGIDRWYSCTDGWELGGPRDVLQLGGSDAEMLASAATEALAYPYSAINLNCGCPSERVAGSGAFGASLMRDPAHVASLCAAMGEATRGELPITVKCRIGVDDDDSYEQLARFVEIVSGAGVSHFIVHARKAILNMKLTPHENRVVPPLKYEHVHRLVADFESARVQFTLNGGICALPEVAAQLAISPQLAGVMVGRDVVNRPWHYAHVDRLLHGDAPHGGRTRESVLQQYAKYAEAELRAGARETALLKPVHNLFHGTPGARAFRRQLAALQAERGAAYAVRSLVETAASCIPEAVLRACADADASDAPEREAASAEGAAVGTSAAMDAS